MALHANITIGIKSGYLSRSMTGIANYTFNILRSVTELDSRVGFVGFDNFSWQPLDLTALSDIAVAQGKDRLEGVPAALDMRSGSRIKDMTVYFAEALSNLGPARTAFRSLKQIRFAATASSQSLDLFHAFNFRPLANPGVPVVPVIYDLSTFRHPEFHPAERVRWLARMANTVARAPLVQTISEFSKREVADVFGYPLEKIVVVPPAAPPLYVPKGEAATQQDLNSLDLRYGHFLLAVGTLEPRKNIRTLIAAYAQLSSAERARCPLVVVGGRGWGDLNLPREATAFVDQGALRFLSGVSDRQLRSLYEGARLLAMPSLYEGFGMPVVEALACGTPVAHSADTSMDEISGDCGIRISALDVDGWAAALRQATEGDEHANAVLRAARIERARHFDWLKSAGKVIDVYRTVLG